MRSWRRPLVALAAVTVGTLALSVATAGANSVAPPRAKPVLTKVAKRSASKAAASGKLTVRKASTHPSLAMPKSHHPDKPDRHSKKTCEHGRDDCTRVHCEHGRDDCTRRHCEHGRDDCVPVTTCSESGDDCAPTKTCSEAGDDCQTKPTCSEPGDDCHTTKTEPTPSEETQGQLPFTGLNVLGIGGLGLLLSGGGLLLARRLRRGQT